MAAFEVSTEAQVRATQLAHEDPVRLAHHGGHEVELHQSQPPCPKWPLLRCPPRCVREQGPMSNTLSPAEAKELLDMADHFYIPERADPVCRLLRSAASQSIKLNRGP